jgi:hypothetical protein
MSGDPSPHPGDPPDFDDVEMFEASSVAPEGNRLLRGTAAASGQPQDVLGADSKELKPKSEGELRAE